MLGKKGFTLVELLVVIIIVGILAAVAIPMMTGNLQRARTTEAVAALGLIRNQLRLLKVETGDYNKLPDGSMILRRSAVAGVVPGIEVDDLKGTYFNDNSYMILTIRPNTFVIRALSIDGSIRKYIDHTGDIRDTTF